MPRPLVSQPVGRATFRKKSPSTSFCRRSYAWSIATVTKSFFSREMMSGFAKVDARSTTPLFQVQPSGWPSIAQINNGFFVLAASRCASRSEIFHGMLRHGSSREGCNCLCNLRNVASSRSVPSDPSSKEARIRYPVTFMSQWYHESTEDRIPTRADGRKADPTTPTDPLAVRQRQSVLAFSQVHLHEPISVTPSAGSL